MSLIARKFLNSVNEVLDLVNFEGLNCTPSLLLITSLTAISITSFTSDVLVIMTSYVASLILIILNREVMNDLKALITTTIYVMVFSLIALSPLLINNQLDYYVIYVLRALASATLLLASIKTLGWIGLANAFYEIRVPSLGRFIVIYVRMLSTLIKDVSKSILCRDARILRNAGLREIPAYASLVGDLFIKGSSRGWKTSLAVNARTMTSNSYINKSTKLRLTKLDLFMSSIAIIEVILQLT
ncbi:MAG: hypothetical protein QXZ63_06795 [Sulfolobales archaeon]